MSHPAPFVWMDRPREGTIQHVYFRRDFELPSAPERAGLNIFVDSNYHLRVNGQFLGFGPVRFYPEYPEYDTYDLKPFLKEGKNVIAAHAVSLGVGDFHHIYHDPGFTAWGEIKAGEIIVKLDTPGEWKCREAAGYDTTTPKFSFAQEPVEVFDQRLDIKDWDQAKADLSLWAAPVKVKEQESWGDLRPRSIPALTNEEQEPARIHSAAKHLDDEEIISFRLLNMRYPDKHQAPGLVMYAWTYIHSPKDQKADCARYWGEYYLNGQRVMDDRDEDAQGRIATRLDLRQGWNYFFVKYAAASQTWDFHLAVPRRAGLVFSPGKKENDPAHFMAAGPFGMEDEAVRCGPSGYEEDPPEIPGGWQAVERPRLPVLPHRALAWKRLGGSLKMPAERVRDLAVPAGENTTFVFDMGGQALGRIFLDYDAPPGTVFEAGIAEDLKNGRPNLTKTVVVVAGDRHIAAGGPSRMETFYPRGFRYLQLAVSDHDAPVTLRKVGIAAQLYPYEKKGSFRCSDDLMNTLWEMGWKTLRLCSEDVYTDCPWRERTLYGGDMFPEFATTLVTSGDPRLARRCLDIFLQSQSDENDWMQSMAPVPRGRTPLSDYPLICLLASDWYVRCTEDREFAAEAYRRFRKLMARALQYRNAEGLYAHPARPFIDHASIERDGISGPLNALISAAWRALAGLARFLGGDADAQKFETLAEETAATVRRHFWDPVNGAYADNLKDGKRRGPCHPAASAWCSLFGITTPVQERSILDHYKLVMRRQLPRNPEAFGTSYAAFYLLGSLYKNGHEAFAEEFIRRAYAAMAEAGDTIWEHFHPRASLVHAWSTAPNYYLSTRILGARLGFPEPADYGRVLIAPQAETVDWAEGAVPHPRGLVQVSWKIEDGRLDLEYQAPEGVPVDVRPQGRLARLELRVNGQKKAT